MCLCVCVGGRGNVFKLRWIFLIGRAQGCQILSLRPLYDKSITVGRIPEAPSFSQAHNPPGFYPERGWEERGGHPHNRPTEHSRCAVQQVEPCPPSTHSGTWAETRESTFWGPSLATYISMTCHKGLEYHPLRTTPWLLSSIS